LWPLATFSNSLHFVSACMQKFTVFSILLSLSVILVISDIVAHNYVQDFEDPSAQEESTAEDEVSLETDEDVALSQEEPATEPDLTVLPSALSTELFQTAGFTTPVLKDTIFSGLVFQFISFSDQSEATVYNWNLFDGESYVGSIYEIKYPSETGSFQGYLALRERAMGLTDLGSVNEVNNYGDASFYFNHKNKLKTVHLIIRTGRDIYAFEYSQSFHETMKKVFDSLGPLL